MRLLICDEELIAGGVETLRIQLLPELARHCETVVWALPVNGGEKLAANVRGITNILIEPMEWPKASAHGMTWSILRRAKKWLSQERFDAIARWLRDARINFLIRKHRCQYLLTTCIFSQPPPRVSSRVFGFVCDVNPDIPEAIRRNITAWVEAADGIFAISEFTRGELVRMDRGCAENVHTLRLAAPPLHPHQPAVASPEFDFYYPAAPNPHKNHLTLFRACLQLAEEGREFRLAISGPGIEGFLPEGHFDHPVMQLTRDFLHQNSKQLASRVMVLGGLTPADVPGVFDNARCILLPSCYEGFGLPLSEALMKGIPVICSDIPAFQEQLDLYDARSAATVVAPGDIGQLARAMGEFLEKTRTQLDRELGAQPARMARWTWADVGRKCFELLNGPSSG